MLLRMFDNMVDAESYYQSLISQGYPEPVAESFTETYYPGYLANQLAKKQQFISQNNVQNVVPNIAHQSNLNQDNYTNSSPYNQQISGTGLNDGLYIVSTQTTKSNTSKILVRQNPAINQKKVRRSSPCPKRTIYCYRPDYRSI